MSLADMEKATVLGRWVGEFDDTEVEVNFGDHNLKATSAYTASTKR